MTESVRAPVDVLIVNYRTGELTRRAVAALAGPSRHVWVWDNSGELEADPPAGATLMSSGANVLYAAASNHLFARAQAPYVLLLNPDAYCTAQDLDALVAALEAAPTAWGAAPRLVDEQGLDQDYRRRLPTLSMLLADRLPGGRRLLRRAWNRLYCRDLDPAQPGTVEQPAAACLLIRRHAAKPALFDEDYPLFGNDLDLARRLSGSGPCCYVADVVVTHVGGASFDVDGAPSRTWLRMEYDEALRRYARRHISHAWLLEPVFFLRRLATWPRTAGQEPAHQPSHDD